MIRKFIDNVKAMLTLSATEITSGIRLVEAVEADQMCAELVAVTGSQASANECIRVALELGKLGIWDSEEVHDMARLWMLK